MRKKQEETLPAGYKIIESGVVQGGDLLWNAWHEEWSSENTSYCIGENIGEDFFGVCRGI